MIDVVVLYGKSGSGKSTIAKYLEKDHGYYRLRFAERLKKMLRDGLGVPDEYVDGAKKKLPCPYLGGVTGQYALQTLGTEWGRNLIDKELWTRMLVKDMFTQIQLAKSYFVVDDLRFVNEQEAMNTLKILPAFKVLTIEVVCPKLISSVADTHISEKEINELSCDWEIDNKGSYSELYEAVYRILQKEAMHTTVPAPTLGVR